MGEFKLELQSGNARFGFKSAIFSQCDLGIWQVILKNYRAPLQYYIKRCATFKSHGWIQTGVAARKRWLWVKIIEFSPVWAWNLMDDLEKQWTRLHVTLKFEILKNNNIGHLFHSTSSFLSPAKAIGGFKLDLQSGTAQFGSKSAIFLYHVILQFDGWSWKTIGHIFCAISSIVHHLTAINEFKLKLQSDFAVPCDTEIWQMTSKNNRALLPCSVMHYLVAIGDSKLELHSGITQFGSISLIYFSRVTLKFDEWPWMTIWHISWVTSSFVRHFIIICEFNSNWCSGPETAKLGLTSGT